MTRIRTERKILQLNEYETQWRNKTNVAKFTPVALGRGRNTPLTINNTAHEFRTEGKVLGIKITTIRYRSHIRERKRTRGRGTKETHV